MSQSHSQPWPLSQTANKSKGICSVCHKTGQLHLKNGKVHRHGPRDKPCPGSDKPPLGPAIALASSQQLGAGANAFSNTSPSASKPLHDVQPVGTVGSTWTPLNHGVIKHIPKSARAACAGHLAGLLRSITNQPDIVLNWYTLFQWVGTVLEAPKRSGKKHNVATCIKKRIASFSLTQDSPDSRGQYGRPKKLAPSLAKSVAAKLEDGNLKAAIRLLISEDTMSPPSTDGLAKLQDKHPSATLVASDLPIPDSTGSLTVGEEELKKAVLSFPAGSSGGPDGLSPQHLKVLVSCREAGSDLLSALTGFVNMILSGRCPREVAKSFFGGRLISLDKKSGGIRPIAIGFTLRRLTSKIANTYGVARLATYSAHVNLE